MRHWKFLALLPLIALTACGTPGPRSVVQCQNPETSPRGGPALLGIGYGVGMTPIPLDSVQFTSANMSNQIAIQHLSGRRTETDTVRVTARVVNCGDMPQALLIRTSFMDRHQVPTEAPSAWHTLVVQPRATSVYEEVSIGRGDVSNYLIELGEAR